MRDGPVGELHWLSAAEAAQAIADKELSPVELMKALLERIATLDPRLNAFIRLDAEAAMAAAKAAEAEIVAGRLRGPLHGVPVGIKDIIDVAGLPTTCHSKILIGQHRRGRRGLRAEAARRRRHRHGQALDARVRHRRAELRPAVAAGAQSVEHRPSSRRLVVGLGRRAWPPACSRWRWAPTPAAACAIPRAAAASSG